MSSRTSTSAPKPALLQRKIAAAKKSRTKAGPSGKDSLADRLLEVERDLALPNRCGGPLPSEEDLDVWFERLRHLLFPLLGDCAFTKAHVEATLRKVDTELRALVFQGLAHCLDCKDRPKMAAAKAQAKEISAQFLEMLPELKVALLGDAQAAMAGDPAAVSTDEVIFCYPGLYAIAAYRVANRLLTLGSKMVPRMLTEHAHGRTGIDIHPGATIGPSFFIDHGTGVVIGETTLIGARVRIYQGVTLGALSVPDGNRLRGQKRHPTVEDDVIIYANATILGGDTVIGRGAVVGGNTWVTSSVEPGARVGSANRPR